MPSERFYANQKLIPHKKVILTEGEFHHLVHVMRTSVGDPVEIVNGAGQLARAAVSQITKRDAHLEIEHVHNTHKPSKELILVQAIARPSRLDYVIEKGTELGMTQLWLFQSKLSERKGVNPSHVDRIKGLMIASLKQCGRLYLPEIHFVDTIDSWKLPEKFHGYFGDVDPKAPWFTEKLGQDGSSPRYIFVTGPESGLTQDETSALRSRNFSGVKLHDNILRTDTASISALSIMSQYIAREQD